MDEDIVSTSREIQSSEIGYKVAIYIEGSTEVDAYALSTVASYCTAGLGNLVEEDITDKPLAALNRGFVYFDNHEVPVEDQVAFCSPSFLNALRETSEVTKFLGQSDFGAGKDTKFEIVKYQGRDLIKVSPARLRTNIMLIDTESTEGGYSWASDSKAINFLMVAKSAVMHVVKYEKVKVISGEVNLAARGFDGYTIFARIYHDVFVSNTMIFLLQFCIFSESVSKFVCKSGSKKV